MNERLLKQWTATEQLLTEAAKQIEGSAYFAECTEFISHNELGLVFDKLTDAGDHCRVNADYWRLLKEAAEVMGAAEQAMECHRKFQSAQAKSAHS